MTTLTLRSVEPERDFEQLAALFTLEQDEPTTAASLTADYEAHKARIFRLRVVENEAHELLGFSWATISPAASAPLAAAAARDAARSSPPGR